MLTERHKTLVKQLLVSEDTFATTLLAICLDAYDVSVFEYEPETLWAELFDDFDALLPAVNKDKLQALITCYTTNTFWQSWEMFANVCNVLSGSVADFTDFDEVTAEEAIWGIYEVMLNFDEREEFSNEIRRFLGVVLKRDGVMRPPDVLSIAVSDTPDGLAQWSDDPEMYNALHDKSKKDNVDLLRWLKERAIALLHEMDTVPLTRRDPEAWKQFHQKAVLTFASLS